MHVEMVFNSEEQIIRERKPHDIYHDKLIGLDHRAT